MKKYPRIDVRGTAEDGLASERQIAIVIATLAKEFGRLPSDLARVWADEDNDELEVYKHLPHHPKMLAFLRKRSIA